MRVLIAEDDPISRRILEVTVRRFGHELAVAADGLEAWELHASFRPEVLISDWMMPGLDGPELCRRIRRAEGMAYTYVILLTARQGHEDVMAGMRAGADDYLTKPLSAAELEVCLVAASRVTGLHAQLAERGAELERLARRTASILDSAGEGIYGVDPDGRLTFVNPAAARMLARDADGLIGRPEAELRAPEAVESSAKTNPDLGWLAPEDLRHVAEGAYGRLDGTTFPVEYTTSPIKDGDATAGAVVVFRDVTERRAVERIKDEFISVVSHELRTPLTSIRGSLGLLAGGALGPLPEKGQRMVQIAVQNTDRLVRLINDILDLERIESGEVTMKMERVDAGDLMRDATEAVVGTARDAGVALQVEPFAALLEADADRIVQTLINLLSNAIKFSDDGAVVRLSGARRSGLLVFQVSDEGRGIPPDQLESIFARFQQVDGSDVRDKGGTGLGLAICWSIVTQHGGLIWAESEPGQGATLTFTLPALIEEEAAVTPIVEDRPAVPIVGRS